MQSSQLYLDKKLPKCKGQTQGQALNTCYSTMTPDQQRFIISEVAANGSAAQFGHQKKQIL